MTHGYGPPREWQPSDEDPDPSRRRRGQGPDAPGTPYGRFRSQPPAPPPAPPPPPPPPAPPGGYSSVPQRPRIPSPPQPARHVGGPPPVSSPPARRRLNAPGPPPAYPAYPPPVPTSPTVPRAVPRPAYPPGALPGAPPGPPTPPPRGRTPAAPPRSPIPAPGRPGAPGRRGAPGRPPPPGRALPPLENPASAPHRVRLKQAVPGLIRHLPHHKPWMVALSVIAIVVVIGTCGFGSYLLVRDDATVIGANPNTTPTVLKRDVSNREADPKPLTIDDVFPNTEIVADPAVPPYKRIGAPQVAADCRVGASGEIGKLLVSLGCNQVVRATYSSTEGAYLVTAGVFNLKDTDAASSAESQIQQLAADASKGRFNGYVPPGQAAVAKALGRSVTHLAFDAHQHFLLYSVIARVDGKDFDAEDPHVKIIVYDLVEKYLRDTVLEQWAIVKPDATPTTVTTP